MTTTEYKDVNLFIFSAWLIPRGLIIIDAINVLIKYWPTLLEISVIYDNFESRYNYRMKAISIP